MTSSEFSQALGTMDPTELALGAGLAGIILAFMFVAAILWYFISAIGYYKMFRKAGEAGWKAFIPYYNDYIRFKFSWQTKSFWIYLAVLLIFQLFQNSENLILNVIVIVAGITMLVLGFKLDIRIAKSFGKGTGWGVLLFFFPFIITLILGFGKAEYIGNPTQPIRQEKLVESVESEESAE